MAEKRTAQVSVRLDDTGKSRLDEYVAWAAKNHLEITEADAARSLMDRGYLAWRGESQRKQKRGRVS